MLLERCSVFIFSKSTALNDHRCLAFAHLFQEIELSITQAFVCKQNQIQADVYSIQLKSFNDSFLGISCIQQQIYDPLLSVFLCIENCSILIFVCSFTALCCDVMLYAGQRITPLFFTLMQYPFQIIINYWLLNFYRKRVIFYECLSDVYLQTKVGRFKLFNSKSISSTVEWFCGCLYSKILFVYYIRVYATKNIDTAQYVTPTTIEAAKQFMGVP